MLHVFLTFVIDEKSNLVYMEMVRTEIIMPKKKANFETDISRLSDIVEQIEDSEIPLDTAISLYKEGLELAAKCGEILGKYEEEILTLQKDANKNFVTKPFED